MYLSGKPWQPTVAGPITAIAFNAPFECLAFSTAHDVTILQRVGAKSIRNDTPGDTDFTVVGRVEGFSSVTCLALYGSVKLNLVVGSRSGLSVWGIYLQQSLMIAASYDYKIAQCAISKGEHYLAVLTPEHKLIYWALEESGPVMHTPTIYDFSSHESPLALSMAITDTNNIVVGTSHGRLYFVDIIGRKRYAGKGFNNSNKVQAIAVYGQQLYVAATPNTETTRPDIISFTQDKYEFDIRNTSSEARTSLPYIGFLKRMEETGLMGPGPTMCSHPRRVSYLRLLFLFTIAVAFVALVCLLLHVFLYFFSYFFSYLVSYLPSHLPSYLPPHLPSYLPSHLSSYLSSYLPSYFNAAGPEDPATATVNKDADTFGDRLAYVGAYVINFYLPSSWEAPANSVLIAVLCVYQFFEKLFV
ncbi:hypothetical protein FRC12_004513 [Ceratobasidium sp. 428]|nr:hypothetical protein FRC12_004513 [Ceratobasidium sp. 428]